MKNIGQTFRQAREEKGWSIEEVSRRTKIHASIIEGIENEDYKKLPPPTYAVGFVKKYARCLELEEKEMVSEYLLQNKEASVVKLRLAQDIHLSNKSFPWRYVLVPVFLIAAGAVLYYAADFSYRYYKDNWSKKEAPEKTAAEPVRSQTAPAQESAGNVFQGASALPGSNTEVALKAVKDVFVSVTDGGNLVFNGIIAANSTETWKSNGSIGVKVGMPDAVYLYVNNAEKGIVTQEKSSPFTIIVTGDQIQISSSENAAQ
jgi:cytoskeleton protein RodZ